MAARITSKAVSVDATVDQLYADSPHRKMAVIHNAGAAAVFVGPSNVTQASGLSIPAGEKLIVYGGYEDTISATLALYGVAAAAQDVRVFETYAL